MPSPLTLKITRSGRTYATGCPCGAIHLLPLARPAWCPITGRNLWTNLTPTSPPRGVA